MCYEGRERAPREPAATGPGGAAQRPRIGGQACVKTRATYIAAWTAASALLAVLAGCAGLPPDIFPTEKPNVLIIVSDDQSWLHTGAAGDSIVKTPSIDKLAREGVYFSPRVLSVAVVQPDEGGAAHGSEYLAPRSRGEPGGSARRRVRGVSRSSRVVRLFCRLYGKRVGAGRGSVHRPVTEPGGRRVQPSRGQERLREFRGLSRQPPRGQALLFLGGKPVPPPSVLARSVQLARCRYERARPAPDLARQGPRTGRYRRVSPRRREIRRRGRAPYSTSSSPGGFSTTRSSS